MALTGVPIRVDVGLWNDGDSRMADSNALRPDGTSGDDEGLPPGNDGESTIMLGICMGRLPAAFNDAAVTGNEGESTMTPGVCGGRGGGVPHDAPGMRDIFVGTAMGVPLRELILGDDRSTLLVGVDTPEPGDAGTRGGVCVPSDILNCDTLETLGFGGAVASTGGSSELDWAWVADERELVGTVEPFEGRIGPTFTTSPFVSISSISLACGSSSSSLSPSSPPVNFPLLSFPSRTADFSVED